MSASTFHQISMLPRLFAFIFLLLFPAFSHGASFWPLTVPVGSGSALIYQPQLDSFDGNVLRGRAVVSYVAGNGSAPVLGALWFVARVVTDRDDRTATLCGFNVTNLKFPPGQEEAAAAVQSAIISHAAASRPKIPIEALASALKQSQQPPSAQTGGFGTQVPAILFSTKPAVLVSIEGEPKLARVDGTPLLRVINSPFTLLLDPASKTYFIKGAANWYSATAATGPYNVASAVPPAVAAFAPLSPNLQDPPPNLVVTTTPAELLVSDGPEQFASIPGTNLIYVSNTEEDIFVEIGSQQIYVLLNGRWFSAASQAGPWNLVLPEALPPDFKMIPADSPKAHVLASVPGTPKNSAALTDYQLPQTAAIKTSARIATVTYDGQPDFQPIEGTTVEYSVNTPYDILKTEGRYYCCNDAVWYVSDTALGPFIPTGTIPEAIYRIPPSNPLYRVTFVRAYYSDANMIWFGYYPGYLGSYLWNGTVVWGTGWSYNPWFGKVYIPRQSTWGYNARYHASAGVWGFHIGVASAQGWVDTGKASGAAGWWGPGGYLEYSDSKKPTRANVYAKDGTRLAIDPRREAFLNTKTQPQIDTAAHVDRDTFLVTDSTGRVYKRDLGGYQRYDGTAGWSRADAGLTKDLDRQFSVTSSSFGRVGRGR